MSKKLEEKRARRLEEERRRAQQHQAARRRTLTTTAIAVVVAIAVVALIMWERRGEESSSTAPIGVPLAEAGCSEVQSYPDMGQGHIDAGTPHEPYNSSPPTSGPHYPQPALAGFYPAALPPEQLVHNLEHGQIVIWYSPDLPDETTSEIEDYIERENDRARANFEPTSNEVEPLLAVPFEGIEGGGSYAMTNWTNLQTCERFSSRAVDEFREQFQGLAPELFTRPFRDGPTAAATATPGPTDSPAEDASPSP